MPFRRGRANAISIVIITSPAPTSIITSNADTPTSLDTPISQSSVASPTTSGSPAPSSPVSSDRPTPSTPEPPSLITSVVTRSQTPGQTSQAVITITKTNTRPTQPASTRQTVTSSAASASGSALSASEAGGPAPGLNDGGKIAVAVVVPLVAVALLVLAGLFLWRRRKQQKDAEEARKKEMEEYNYNPNNDPTIPGAAGMSPDGTEDSTLKDPDQGYRGWGTTSTARKASNTMGSSNPGGMARSDSGGNGYKGPHSPTAAAPVSDNHSGDPLVEGNSPDSEGIGALGVAPVATNRSQGGVNRGPSNASSAYSGANRSDTSGDGAPPNHVGSPQYYNDVMHHDDSGYNGPPADGSWGGQPVIREVQARRNTRIENPSVFPQQGNSGIAQNF